MLRTFPLPLPEKLSYNTPKLEYIRQEVLMKGQIFTRMSPEDKAKLV